MSAQTGVAPASGPTSRRAVDRARFRFSRLRTEPNPVWIRELKQAARLGRTPILLAGLTILFTLLVSAIGGIASTQYNPATTGVILFQVFFSCAWFVVTLIGPAVAANTIASEREGHTWEAVILTGLPPGRVARGKFLAAFTAIGAYIVALVPVGALPFLFGGVTATEVVVAFALLFLIASLSVAFGLAVSSKVDRLRTAIVVTLLLSFPASAFGFLAFGVGLGGAAHKLWSGVLEWGPIWLPTAYDRADFDALYVLVLVVLPVVCVTLPAWFLYEVTIANLTSVTDDRSSGLKRWFVVAAPVLALTCAVPVASASSDVTLWAASAGSFVFVFLTFAVFLFLGDPIGPSRRVVAHWDRTRRTRLSRFFGPSITHAAEMLFVATIVCLGLVVAGGAIAAHRTASAYSAPDLGEIEVFAFYSVCFLMFLIGFGAFVRARTGDATKARAIVALVLFSAAAGPWIVAAICGIVAEHTSPLLLSVAAPSPLFAFQMMSALRKTEDAPLFAGGACAITWAGLGALSYLAARRHARAVVRQHESMLAETDRILAAEDEAAAARANEAEAAPAPDDAPATDDGSPAEAT
ncbi:MAG TPA: ABC transporter permease [Polyangia bacterium]|jgi:ABC-type transport system involved in multi-copper enzyme maturation permease subunit|nr:ABC transporter permease [Polyangia bacterium]